MSGMRMPVNYVVEMFCDRVAASRIYNKEAYTDRDAYDYFNTSRQHYLIHPETEKLLEKLLVMLMEKGEEETFQYIKSKVLKQGYDIIK
jgi:pyrroloquinoline quinone (PQQ) biosynthesis protein C